MQSHLTALPVTFPTGEPLLCEAADCTALSVRQAVLTQPEFSCRSLLGRRPSLGCRPSQPYLYVPPKQGPYCWQAASAPSGRAAHVIMHRGVHRPLCEYKMY